MVKKFSLPDFGFQVEIGKVAQQADGAVWFQQGGTVLLATVVAAPSSEFPGFLPLTVDYREHYSAAGKIPGGYYKREGKSTDHEVLTARLIDRAIRPIFPDYFFDQIQVLATVYSIDKEHSPSAISLVASSLALVLSDIPFYDPVGAVEIGRIDGKWVINPKYSDSRSSDVRIIVAGTQEGICMVEGAANELDEASLVDVLFMAHEQIKKIVVWQKAIAQEIGKTKRPEDQSIDWKVWEKHALDFLTEERVKRSFIEDKFTRDEKLEELKLEFLGHAKQFQTAVEIPDKYLLYVFDEAYKQKFTDLVLSLSQRVDSRGFDKVRPISIEVGLLPFTHGSALFVRGQTQALVSVTLGGGQDEQRLESLMDDEAADGAFMLHYNFPPFSVGEVRPMRGPGRREVGHGHLAASSFKYMLPDKEKFPYTIRIVTDILESNGSSSMATVCGSTMALMQGGVPIKKMVGGVAMGLLRSTDGDIQVLTDINGFEDNFGLMDFKVAGTGDGITAIQMDIKYRGGFTREIFEAALEKARNGRMHILGEMRKCMSEPAKQMSELVPKVVSFKVESDKIGAIIGSGGKTIREIIDTTKVASIDIEDDGIVKIFGTTGTSIDQATKWVKVLAGQINVGERFEGKIKRMVEFGMFVELVPGQDGLVHISMIARDKQKDFQKLYHVDDVVSVEVADYDPSTGRIRLRLLEQK
jgi:polyribonucleotide nucleotidyltransferase